MIWSLPFVPMRQQQHQSRLLSPFGSSGGNKLINNYLGHVGKIPKLRLPQHKRARRVHTIAVLESQSPAFAQWAVIDRKRRTRLRKVLKRNIGRSCMLIMQYRVAMTERPAVLHD